MSVAVTLTHDDGQPLNVKQVLDALDGEGWTEVNPGTDATAYQPFSRRALVNRLLGTTEGRRNKALHGCAKDAARQGQLPEYEAALREAALTIGLTPSEIENTIRGQRSTVADRPPYRAPVADVQDEPPDDDMAAALDGDDETARLAWDAEVARRAHEHRLNAAARQLADDLSRPPAVTPPVRSLKAFLDEPDTSMRYRIDKLAPAGGRIMLAAQYKAGKSHTVGNLLRSLVDGEPFLGQFEVSTPAHHAVLIDTELPDNTLRGWFRDQKIGNTAAVADVVALRGNVSAFNLLDDRCRDGWARRLRDLGCDYLVLDCLRPVLDALGLDENHDTGRFLVAYDALLHDAGVEDSLMVQHMGHANERARGDSRLQDWPDATWRIVREGDDPDSPRFFTAYGRDVNVAEGRLSLDPSTRRLTYLSGSRGDAKAEAARNAVMTVLARDAKEGGPGLSGRAIEAAVADYEHTRKAVRDGLRLAIEAEAVVVRDGDRRAVVHSIANPCSECGWPVAVDGRTRHQNCIQERAWEVIQ